MIYLLAFCRVATGLIFTISSVGKAWNISKFRQSIIGFGFFDKRLSSVVAIFVLCGEIAVILLVVIGGPLLLLGFLLTSGLLLIFCGALVAVLVRGLRVTCNCFGPSEKPVSFVDIRRNLGFISCELGGCTALVWTRESQTNLNSIEWLLIGFGATAFVVIWTQLGEIMELFRPQ